MNSLHTVYFQLHGVWKRQDHGDRRDQDQVYPLLTNDYPGRGTAGAGGGGCARAGQEHTGNVCAFLAIVLGT